MAKERKKSMSEDRCVICGEIVPEGRMVCPDCEAGKMSRMQQLIDGRFITPLIFEPSLTKDACPMCKRPFKTSSVSWHKYPDEKPPESGDYLVSEYSCITRNISFVWVEEWDGEKWIDSEDYETFVIEPWVYAWMPLPEPMSKEGKNDEVRFRPLG